MSTEKKKRPLLKTAFALAGAASLVALTYYSEQTINVLGMAFEGIGDSIEWTLKNLDEIFTALQPYYKDAGDAASWMGVAVGLIGGYYSGTKVGGKVILPLSLALASAITGFVFPEVTAGIYGTIGAAALYNHMNNPKKDEPKNQEPS